MTDRYSIYAPVLLRLTMAGVFAWFGISQLTDPNSWSGFVPTWATSLSGIEATTIVTLNGLFEIAGSVLLIVGIFVRPVAILLGAHLFVIALELLPGAIGVRDLGLTMATFAIALHGKDSFCFSVKK
ncbi:MAG: DoxX family protein [Anaplasmataceae bacterium]|nr:DoxX family protein [Anaplasmataceae bacterium]